MGKGDNSPKKGEQGFQKTGTKVPGAPTPSAIQANLENSVFEYGGPKGGTKGYEELSRQFEAAKAKVDSEISIATRGHDLSKKH